MGNPYYEDDVGQMCFNGAKSWQLGWYIDATMTVDPLTDALYSTKSLIMEDLFCLGSKDFKLELLTDMYAEETYWTLESSSGMVLSGSGYASSTLYEETYCVPHGGQQLTFTIYDHFGDGLCCEGGQGSWNVWYKGQLMGSGGEFGSSDSVTFTTDLIGTTLTLPTILEPPSQSITMVGVADYGNNPNGHPVVVKIETGTDDDYFLAFNRATGLNGDNDLADDKVTIVKTGENGEAYSLSYLEAFMGQGESHTLAFGDSVTGTIMRIAVTSINLATNPAQAVVEIDYWPKSILTSAPTTSPSFTPTLSPVAIVCASLSSGDCRATPACNFSKGSCIPV